MQRLHKFYFLSWQYILFLVSILLVVLFSWAYQNYNHHSFNALRFQNALHQKSKEAEIYADKFVEKLRANEEWFAVDSTDNSKPKGIEVLVYKEDSLCAWTNQVLPYKKESVSILSRRVVKLTNTWYIINRIPYKEWDLFTLVSVKTEYPYNNDFLSDEYAINLPLDLCHDIVVDKNEKGVKVKDIKGNYLFTAQECASSNPLYANWAVLFLFITILLYVQLIIHTIKRQDDLRYNIIVFLLSILMSAIFYYLHISYLFPKIISQTPLFSPLYFGASDMFPNMGSMLIFAILVFSEAFIFYKYLLPSSYEVKLPTSNIRKSVTIGLIFLATFFYWYIQNSIVTLLVSNSASAPIVFRITDIGVLDVVRLFVTCLLWLSVVLVVEKAIKVFLIQLSRKQLIVHLLASMVVVACFSFKPMYLLSVAAYMVITYMLFWVTKKKSKHAYNTFIWFVFVFAAYAVYSFYYHNVHNERQERKLLVENLSFKLLQEEDPLTELMLKESEDLIEQDSIIIRELEKEVINDAKLGKYISKKYLIRYLKRYEIQVIPCWPEGEVKVEENGETHDCYDYFNSLIQEYGTQVLGSQHYYFLKNNTGEITYFGVFKINEGDPEKEVCMYIELVSKPYFEGPGYPELLLSQREAKLKESLSNYSYGKYVDDVLVKQTGEYAYPIHLERITKVQNDLGVYEYEDFSHMPFHPVENVCVVLSKPKVGLAMLLVAFSIFFISFFIFGAILLAFTRAKRERLIYVFSVQERIQIAFIGLMLALLIIIAGGSVWQTIRRFEIKNNQMLSEKTRSVLMELEHKIGSQNELTPAMEEYLTGLLKKFSSVFYTDINMYDVDGRLLATSRPELFDRGLSGHLMDSKGYIELRQKGELEFIQRESIGKLEYLSAYVPLYNVNNQLLAYLNMPYFVGTSELREEVSSLVMAIVNFYLIFLIIVIGLTVVVSKRITHPLMVIQSKLSQLKLGGRNEKIEYKGNDEIGQLVTQYNRMVDEMAESAEKLAKSERESAWREMARQIAHEIKNPLTPMKLSIQYLEMAQRNNDADFENKLKRVSSTLIDQIDKLSSIASEFSNFATMPIAKRKRIDVIESLMQCVNLFDKSKEADIIVKDNGVDSYSIYADGEQMISVFNNLLQNAIQSIPSNREGCVNVTIEKKEESVLIKIKDNGKGISEEAQEKLFVPNFTTKTSGMGLGLAIVKNIVKNTKGNIWFETEENVGTEFFVEFPSYGE
ncbi:sensor histidine kinase [Labilibacter marinus]|uniref:sensor histidine kinase n=1 Tax=Labilibacter marinus TaxID=1477105 RepID=UPI00094FE56B|nr:HAMP domain-containing sensor histidine kinase [Labilibacter marinus]